MKIKEQVNNIIKEAKFLEVTDIHFQPQENIVKLYYRLLGNLVYQKSIDLQTYNKILRYLKFITKLDISVSKMPQDGSFYIKDNDDIFIRISTIPLINSESLVIRMLSDQTEININNVSFYEEDIKVMKEVILEQTGLFIFTGPTGSGKTSTIYSIMDDIAKNNNRKIITIENPVEIINKNLVQVQIDEKIGIDYSASLKSVLRQDPDIIMIGEIRDELTARNVFRAALTGHTVVSTMHTKNIYGVVERFLDFGFLQSEIESILIGISNQRLILNNKGLVKSLYHFAVGEELLQIIKSEKQKETIEQKIIKAKEWNKKIKSKALESGDTLSSKKTSNNSNNSKRHKGFKKVLSDEK